jgi:hypothetical protein
MYKPSTSLAVNYFPSYICDQFLTELVTKVKPNINSVLVRCGPNYVGLGSALIVTFYNPTFNC